jgi:biopolymer transport protein ExbD
MRRFSQRSHLVTLSEINITPLLDLAFVLLIIFVITTPLLEQSLKLNLPAGGQYDKNPPPKDDIRTVEVSPSGFYVMAGKQMALNEVESTLVQAFRANPRLKVAIRADTKEHYGRVLDIVHICMKNDIRDIGFATQKDKK